MSLMTRVTRVTRWKRARLVLLALLVTFGVVLLARQTNLLDRYFIFFPDRQIALTPGNVGLVFEDVSFAAADGTRLHGWFIPGDSDVTLLWFHGNAGNIGHRVDNIALIHRRLGVNVFIFDYRGYGRSDGKPSEQGTYMDADAALEYLRSRDGVDPEKIVLFGRSLGASVAVEMATRYKAYAVILESPFTSISAMARRTYGILAHVVPVGAIVKSRYDSMSKIKDVHAPLMVLHGDRDDIVPFDVGRELFEAANEPKRFYTIEGASHNDTYATGGEPYFDAIRRFLEGL